MLSFAYKRFDGVVSEPGNPSRSSAKGLDAEDRALLALGETLALAREASGDTRAHSLRAREPAVAKQLPS
jgi:hypothetical protein